MEEQEAVETLETLQYEYCQSAAFRKHANVDDKIWRYLYEHSRRNGTIRPNESLQEFKDQAAKSFEISHPLIARSKFLNPWWSKILESILHEVEISLKTRYNGYTGKYLLGSLPFGQVNGFACSVLKNNYKLIVLSDGTFGFVNLMAKAVAQAFPLDESSDSLIMERSIVLQHVASTNEITNRIIDLTMCYLVKMNPFETQSYFPNSEHLFIYENLRDAMETFIIGHEFGHIIRGHLSNEHEGIERREKIVIDHFQEIEADNVGMNICLDVFSNRNIGTAIGFAGPDFFFVSMIFVEKCFNLLSNGVNDDSLKINGSHPLHQLRRHWVRANLDLSNISDKEETLYFSNTLELILKAVYIKMEPLLIEAHKRGVRPSELWETNNS